MLIVYLVAGPVTAMIALFVLVAMGFDFWYAFGLAWVAGIAAVAVAVAAKWLLLKARAQRRSDQDVVRKKS
jgi:membrane protein implicated in regulation of membrane protease activity